MKKLSQSQTLHDPEYIAKISIRIPVLSGQACLAVVRNRLIRTKRYHLYKAKIAAHVGAQMMIDGTVCAPRGSLYRIDIAYKCKGWGVDLDNAQKAILDSLIGVAVDDDRAIIELHIRKETHSKEERLDFEVYKIGSREVPPPAKKRALDPDAPSKPGKVRPRRVKGISNPTRRRRRRKVL